MLYEASQVHCRRRWGNSSSDQLHFVFYLGTQFELRVEPIRQAEGIPFIGF